jgi:hypothetical protein
MKTILVKDNFDGNTYEARVSDDTTEEEILEHYAMELDCTVNDLRII